MKPITHYIINLIEFAQSLKNALTNNTELKIGKAYCYSAIMNGSASIDIDGKKALTKITITPTTLVAQDHFASYRITVYDINGGIMFTQDVPLMECMQGFNFPYAYEVGEISRITATFSSTSPWHERVPQARLDVECYEVSGEREIVIICKDKNTGEIVYTESQFYIAPSSVEIKSPEPWGYKPIKQTQTVNLVLSGNHIYTIEWEYERIIEGKVVIVQYKTTKGKILKEEEIIILPTEYGELLVSAQILPNTYLVSPDSFTLNIDNDSPPTTYIVFWHKEI